MTPLRRRGVIYMLICVSVCVRVCLEPPFITYININCRAHNAPRDLKFWIINHMTKPNKPYDTTPRLDPSI